MSRFAVLPAALILLLTAAGHVAAAAPIHSTTTGTFTLADAIFEYESFGVYDGDCGDFAFTFRFDESGALLELTQTGLFEYVEVDGHRVPTIPGRATTDFTADPPARRDTPHASTETPAFVCEALR
jgi:hypothetical protein